MNKTLNLGHHSWHDYISHAAKRIHSNAVAGAGNSSIDNNYEARGTRTLDEAIQMALNGWQEGAKAMAKILDTLPPSSEALPDWMLDVSGSICNVPAFIAGEPECMWNMSECKRSEHRVTLIVPGTYSGGIPQESAQRYAVAIAAVVRALEASGINPAVYSLFKTSSAFSDTTVISSVAVREFGEPLDLAKIAMAFHPSFLRRIEFAWREMTQAAADAKVADNGYGRSEVSTRDDVNSLLGDVGYVVIALEVHDAVKSGVDTLNIVRSSVMKQIKELS